MDDFKKIVIYKNAQRPATRRPGIEAHLPYEAMLGGYADGSPSENCYTPL
ncbi:hypothetical protein BB561_003289 [Smittium simulii]|uniref:Uncharacterized protein n=1 Tax=Smittium simulii TaxID=133385 RepID=A0A2T9YM72_9FUNG|nr:hypothetical protein BB561_003289 [Smittium simulii]